METFTKAQHGQLDQGRCPHDGCERLLDWFLSTMAPGKVVLCCGHHGGGFVHIVEDGSPWATAAKEHGNEILPPVPVSS